MSKNPAVIVAGGGIGGLSAAVGLANNGCGVTVLEQADTFGETGAGIQLGPNAFHELLAGMGGERERDVRRRLPGSTRRAWRRSERNRGKICH